MLQAADMRDRAMQSNWQVLQQGLYMIAPWNTVTGKPHSLAQISQRMRGTQAPLNAEPSSVYSKIHLFAR